jgi:thiamine-phosphate pyrophosphorylase
VEIILIYGLLSFQERSTKFYEEEQHMNTPNLSDLVQQSTSFRPEVCQKCSVQIVELFNRHDNRPTFPSILPSTPISQSADLFVETIQSFFLTPSVAPSNGLYGIINLTPESSVTTIIQRATEMVLGGVAVVQLRPKKCKEDQTLQVGRLLQQLLIPHHIPLIINDAPHLADALGAQGVHLGQTDEDPTQVKERFPKLIIGQSTHTTKQVARANQNRSVDWIALGPIFQSPTKKGHAPIVGCETLKATQQHTAKPLIAIGGITTPMHAFHIGQNGAKYGAAVSALAQPHQTRFNALALGLGLWLGQHSTKETA